MKHQPSSALVARSAAGHQLALGTVSSVSDTVTYDIFGSVYVVNTTLTRRPRRRSPSQSGSYCSSSSDGEDNGSDPRPPPQPLWHRGWTGSRAGPPASHGGPAPVRLGRLSLRAGQCTTVPTVCPHRLTQVTPCWSFSRAWSSTPTVNAPVLYLSHTGQHASLPNLTLRRYIL